MSLCAGEGQTGRVISPAISREDEEKIFGRYSLFDNQSLCEQGSCGCLAQEVRTTRPSFKGQLQTTLRRTIKFHLEESWMHEDEVKLEEAQSDIVEMAHTALGHMVALKKKELLLAAREMSQEEFDQLVAARSEATESGRIGGGGVGAGEHDGGTDDNGSSIIEGERGAANVSIEAMSEGETDAV